MAKMTIKLAGLTFDRSPRIPGVRAGDLISIDFDTINSGPLVGWQISIRPGALFFISPPGWENRNATSPHTRDPKAPVNVYEVPRTDVFLHWTCDITEVPEVLKSGKYDGAPLGPPPIIIEPSKSILATLPPSQRGDA